MEALTSLQKRLRAPAQLVGPSVVGLGRGWGLGSGVVIGASTRSPTRQRAPRPGHGGIRRRGAERQASGPRPTRTSTLPSSPWTPATHRRSRGNLARLRAWHAGAGARQPGGRGLRTTLGFVASDGRSFRGPRGRRIGGAIEHTAPLPRGSSGGPLVDVEGRLLGLNAMRLDGGADVAVPATAAVKERAQALARGETPSSPRLGVAVAPPRAARRMRRAVGLPERSGLLVRASRTTARRQRPASRRATCWWPLTDAIWWRGHALRGARRTPESLELTVVRGTEERTVTVRLRPRRGRGVSPLAEAPPPVEAEALDAYHAR